MPWRPSCGDFPLASPVHNAHHCRSFSSFFMVHSFSKASMIPISSWVLSHAGLSRSFISGLSLPRIAWFERLSRAYLPLTQAELFLVPRGPWLSTSKPLVAWRLTLKCPSMSAALTQLFSFFQSQFMIHFIHDALSDENNRTHTTEKMYIPYPIIHSFKTIFWRLACGRCWEYNNGQRHKVTALIFPTDEEGQSDSTDAQWPRLLQRGAISTVKKIYKSGHRIGHFRLAG